MKIIKFPNKILKVKSESVNIPLSKNDLKLAEKMIEHIKNSQKITSNERAGIGLAAIQVGVPKKMIYINVPATNGNNAFEEFLINPRIKALGIVDAALNGGEGCLSVDEDKDFTKGLVHRKNKIIIEAYSLLKKKKVIISKTGYHAIVLQHEMDHLKGKLFFERIDKNARWKTRKEEIII